MRDNSCGNFLKTKPKSDLKIYDFAVVTAQQRLLRVFKSQTQKLNLSSQYINHKCLIGSRNSGQKSKWRLVSRQF